jgi:hypothetical protein
MRAMQRANQPLLLDPDQAMAHTVKAFLILWKTKPNDAASANEVIAEAEASLRADLSLARAYFPMALGEMLLGHYEKSISHLEQAMRISPRDPLLGAWHSDMGRDLLGLRRTTWSATSSQNCCASTRPRPRTSFGSVCAAPAFMARSFGGKFPSIDSRRLLLSHRQARR